MECLRQWLDFEMVLLSRQLEPRLGFWAAAGLIDIDKVLVGGND